ncbi:Cytochrome c1 2 [Hibiscus syriacus]|uniref:Cytochrome c1 2 n=1 Tax=Hibiscus syriacus TaxID=106335 RepID=A0A6A3ALY5_HIBSY|nr:Cytochrome c1 2 [Hibiscus syriacus]
MAGGLIHQVLRRKLQSQSTVPTLLWFTIRKFNEDAGYACMRTFLLFGAGISGFLGFATIASADEAEHGFTNKCVRPATLSLISYRDLVGVAYTEEETKAMAAEIEVIDGPNDEGEMLTRPGKLSDRFPQPYANEQAARFANGGAYPPDLSLITKIRDGLHYNTYFPGGTIAMPKMLIDGAMEYEDGTPATEAQMGKDVVTFFSWAAEPEMEERKLMGFKWIFVLSSALIQAGYYRRLRWSVLKSRKLIVDVVN